MSTPIDISVLPVFRQDGFDQAYLPGLHVVAPPRRAARGRKNDLLTIFLSFESGSQISPSQYTQIIENLAKGFYRTPGTATTALRDMVQSLNDYLFKRNRTASGRGRQVVALLTLAVIRGNNLYLAHSGPVHGLLITSTGIRHIHDPETAGRGLGLNQNIAVSFHQAEISPNDLIILSPHIPDGWDEETFRAAFSHDLSAFHRRLLADAGPDLTSVVMIAKTGSGQIQLVNTSEIAKPPPAALPQQPVAQKTSRAKPAPTPEQLPTDTQSKPHPVDPAPVKTTPSDKPAVEDTAAAPSVSTSPLSSSGDDIVTSQPQTSSTPKQSKIGAAAIRARRSARDSFGKISQGLRSFFGRLLPEDAEIRLPTSMMAFIAVAVPVVIVTIGAIVVNSVGRQTQYEFNYDQAKVIADYALTLTEPGELHTAWSSALVYIENAEGYRVTEESQMLRSKALLILDGLDSVTRLNFETAILGTLDRSLSVKQMLATGSDLYMLDANDGTVLHATLTGSGQYTLDTDFRCGPGQYGENIVVQLVDIAAFPRPTQTGATIVGIDSNGILLYCSPNGSPVASALIPPDNNWGSPQAITVENGNLYVLDPLVNAVWIFSGEDFLFEQPPRFFFAEEVPSIQTAVDIALDGDELYLLKADGLMIKCSFSEIPEAPTTCQDPAHYSTSPSGEAAIPISGNYMFTKMANTARPEPSIFLLDAFNQAIYHFSLRLNLDAQYRSATTLPEGDLDAFAVSPNRDLFIAVGNQIFVAFLR